VIGFEQMAWRRAWSARTASPHLRSDIKGRFCRSYGNQCTVYRYYESSCIHLREWVGPTVARVLRRT